MTQGLAPPVLTAHHCAYGADERDHLLLGAGLLPEAAQLVLATDCTAHGGEGGGQYTAASGAGDDTSQRETVIKPHWLPKNILSSI